MRLKGRVAVWGRQAKPDRIQPEILKATPVASCRPLLAGRFQGFMQLTSTQQRAMTWCLIAALVLLALWFLGPVLTPFVVAAVLAYALNPVVNKLDHLGQGKISRVLAVLMVEMSFILIVISILLLVVPIFAKELPLLIDLLGLLQGTGMSLDQTLQVIGQDFGNVMPVLSREIQLANLQYSRGGTRERSFGRMSEIYQNENLVALTSLMTQIDKYGGAVQEPLRVFGERLREQRKAKMKELIGKISVKMTGVMVVTLLPALIIITAGPGFLAVIRALGAMTK